MDMSELEETLPIGFHDANIFSIAIDYANREATLTMGVWVAYEDEETCHTPLMRRAELVVRGLEYAVVPSPNGPPPKNLSVTENRRLDVIGYAGVPAHGRELPSLPDGAFAYSFFVTNWNEAIVLAAHDAELRWLEPG